MAGRTPVTEEQFWMVKGMVMSGKHHQETSETVGVSGSTVSRIANSKDYADYKAAGYARTSKWHEREKAKKQGQIEMADLVPAEQPHESLNRDMLKEILQSMQVLAANQSIIASKLDALIQKWE